MTPVLRAPWRRDLALTLALLTLLLLWEASRWDLVLAGWYGTAKGFALRDAWWTRQLLHDGGRALGWTALAACAWFAWSGDASRRRERYFWIALVLVGLLLVPTLKRVSETSCPYELALFGGRVPYLPHWPWTGADGGPGHCFPSGHAVAAFAFLPLYFQWRGERPRLARAFLLVVLVAGALFGWAQLARGAHFPSHTLWSAWLCWVIGVAGATRAQSLFATDPPPLVTAAVARGGDVAPHRAVR